MATDDERRRVAERLREAAGTERGPLGDIGFTEAMHRALGGDDWRDMTGRLADLIEPAPTSSDKAPTDCDPTERGIDSIYDWCFSGLEGADGAEDYLYCSIMSAIEDYRHPERVTARTARPVDREALLAEAKEADKCAWYYALDHDEDELRDRLTEAAEDFSGIARRIREACGEVAS